jgi:glycosyltransferase involved in cell wall biosynthesis
LSIAIEHESFILTAEELSIDVLLGLHNHIKTRTLPSTNTMTTIPHQPPAPVECANLVSALRAFVVSTLEELAERHAPGLSLPRVLAGYPVGPDARADLIYTLGLLADAGVETVAGRPTEEVLRALLSRVDGSATSTFFSYRIAETLARWGPFADNPLLIGLDSAQVEQVRTACDATDAIKSLETSLPRNYVPVLARCELARQRLGLAAQGEVLDHLIERTRALFTEQSGGFVDDARHRAGRFDVYTLDCYLFAAPLVDRLGEAWSRGASHALGLVEFVEARNGAAIPWGRSAGALALCLTLEMAALGFEHGLIPQQAAAPWLARAERAFATLRDWFAGGLIRAHQHRSPYAYRGPARRLQMTFDCLGKMTLAAVGLSGAPERSQPSDEAVDRVLWFDDARRHGVWSYHSEELSFVLPLVGATTTDYLPALQSPGLFEVPVDSPLATGLPFAIKDGVTFAPAGAPASVEKHADGITIEHHGWHRTGEVNAHFETAGLAARRRAVYSVRGRAVSIEEELWFDAVPDIVALQVADSQDRPLRVTFEITRPHVVTTIDTDGIREYRSYWGELPRVHQADIEPARHLTFRWTVQPKYRILSPSTQHSYVRCLYSALADDIALIPWTYQAGLDEQVVADCDGFHLHWPERMMPRQAELHQRFITALKRHGIPILWTQHNLTPHDPSPENDTIYRAWAVAADAVIHHSVYGMQKARAALPYSPRAQHHVIPHGCFGEPGMRLSGNDRRAVEASLGLRHGVLRLGVIGAPRPGKRVDLVMAAVAGSARDNIELVTFSLREDEQPPADRRIVARPYSYVPQSEYDALLGTVDLLVLPFYGDAMLTTGLVADAIGRGVPCLTSPWPYLTETLGDAALPYGSSAEDLRERLDRLSHTEIGEAARRMAALRPLYDWARISALHLRVWEELTALDSARTVKENPQ